MEVRKLSGFMEGNEESEENINENKEEVEEIEKIKFEMINEKEEGDFNKEIGLNKKFNMKMWEIEGMKVKKELV